MCCLQLSHFPLSSLEAIEDGGKASRKVVRGAGTLAVADLSNDLERTKIERRMAIRDHSTRGPCRACSGVADHVGTHETNQILVHQRPREATALVVVFDEGHGAVNVSNAVNNARS